MQWVCEYMEFAALALLLPAMLTGTAVAGESTCDVVVHGGDPVDPGDSNEDARRGRPRALAAMTSRQACLVMTATGREFDRIDPDA